MLYEVITTPRGTWRWEGAPTLCPRPRSLPLWPCRRRDRVGSGLITETFTRYYHQVDTDELAEKFIYSSLKSSYNFV